MSLMEFNDFLEELLCLILTEGNSLQVFNAIFMFILIIVTNLWLDSIRSKQSLSNKWARQPTKKNKYIFVIYHHWDDFIKYDYIKEQWIRCRYEIILLIISKQFAKQDGSIPVQIKRNKNMNQNNTFNITGTM